jgi:hypothetical protein
LNGAGRDSPALMITLRPADGLPMRIERRPGR